MADCERCGRDLGLLHRSRLCDSCRQAADLAAAARARDGADAIHRIRTSGGSDAAATAQLAAVIAAERADPEQPADAIRQVESAARVAAEEEIRSTLAVDDPTGDLDLRLFAVTGALVGATAQMAVLQPYSQQLLLRSIRRGAVPALASVSVQLDPGEQGLFECAAELLEPARVSGTKGSFASTRVRLTKDVSVRIGGFGAESSQKRVEMHATDKGTLTVTTARVVFIGDASTVQFERNRVLTVVTDPPARFAPPSITFHFERQKPVGFRLAPDAVTLLDAILRAQIPAPGVATAQPPPPAAPAKAGSTRRPSAKAPAAKPAPGPMCQVCGKPLGNSWLSCPHCGARITS